MAVLRYCNHSCVVNWPGILIETPLPSKSKSSTSFSLELHKELGIAGARVVPSRRVEDPVKSNPFGGGGGG